MQREMPFLLGKPIPLFYPFAIWSKIIARIGLILVPSDPRIRLSTNPVSITMIRLTVGLVLVALTPFTHATEQRYGNGYIVVDQATEIDASIDQLIYFDAGRCGNTVLDALGYVLEGTGYVLAPPQESDPRITELLNQPLPTFQDGNTGLMTLSSVLKALGGRGWVLVEDPVRRYVSYQINEREARQTFQKVK